MLPGREQQRDGPADRFPHYQRVANLELIQERCDHADEVLGGVGHVRDVRIAVAGVVQRIHLEASGQLGDDVLKHVELGSQRMEQHQRRAITRDDVSESNAVNRDGADRDVRRPAEALGRAGSAA